MKHIQSDAHPSAQVISPSRYDETMTADEEKPDIEVCSRLRINKLGGSRASMKLETETRKKDEKI